LDVDRVPNYKHLKQLRIGMRRLIPHVLGTAAAAGAD